MNKCPHVYRSTTFKLTSFESHPSIKDNDNNNLQERSYFLSAKVKILDWRTEYDPLTVIFTAVFAVILIFKQLIQFRSPGMKYKTVQRSKTRQKISTRANKKRSLLPTILYDLKIWIVRKNASISPTQPKHFRRFLPLCKYKT